MSDVKPCVLSPEQFHKLEQELARRRNALGMGTWGAVLTNAEFWQLWETARQAVSQPSSAASSGTVGEEDVERAYRVLGDFLSRHPVKPSLPVPSVSPEREQQDEEVGRELIAILSHHCGERGDSEGAVETLNRIIRENDRPFEPPTSVSSPPTQQQEKP